MDLKGLSAVALRDLAAKATKLAADLEKEQPTYELALLSGVRDLSYKTVRYGWVAQYDGEAIIKMDNGTTWKAVGHRSVGTAEDIYKEAYIEFIKLD